MSQQSGDTSGEEFWMDTDETTGGVAVSTGDKQLHVQQGSQQPNLNITRKEGDLKGISVILKESFRGELRDEMHVEMGVMIKGIVDGVLKGFNEKIEELNVRIDDLKTENSHWRRIMKPWNLEWANSRQQLRPRNDTVAANVLGSLAMRRK